MRLIDADAFKTLVTVVSIADGLSGGFLNEFCRLIDSQKTAYDVDKVVEQLEEYKRIMESSVQQDCYGEECKFGDCIKCAFEKAIETVKAGGVDG